MSPNSKIKLFKSIYEANSPIVSNSASNNGDTIDMLEKQNFVLEQKLEESILHNNYKSSSSSDKHVYVYDFENDFNMNDNCNNYDIDYSTTRKSRVNAKKKSSNRNDNMQ